MEGWRTRVKGNDGHHVGLDRRLPSHGRVMDIPVDTSVSRTCSALRRNSTNDLSDKPGAIHNLFGPPRREFSPRPVTIPPISGPNLVGTNRMADMDKEAAFQKIYDEYRHRIYRMCCYYVSGQEDRKDLYQEVFKNLWKGLESFRGDSTLSTWAYRVTVNSALSFLARARRGRRRLRSSPSSFGPSACRTNGMPTTMRSISCATRSPNCPSST